MHEKSAETVVQATYSIHATFGDSLTFITDNGKEFKNDIFQKVACELE